MLLKKKLNILDKLGKIKIKRNGNNEEAKIIPKTNKINLIVNNIETRKTDYPKINNQL